MFQVGDSIVFRSAGRQDRAFVGKIISFWEHRKTEKMNVKVYWYYHSDDVKGCNSKLPYPVIKLHIYINILSLFSYLY